ncbi:hypothetical protein [Variovorax sp. LG9.2]|uniref:hypothetical protein n=1 Tax=Variovorax sp. LG9.2 TaxID=3048626 RepID=UPI002B22513E|nr:hypothetical protein [Variovorax sp. LG9.2]MEB0056494.1 hypothetical protein [Variovorax sp. LG9.2]
MDITTPSSLADLQKLDEYQRSTSHIFPGIQSIRWYVRQHREDLVRSGALLTIAGRHWVQPVKFDRCVIALGEGIAA